MSGKHHHHHKHNIPSLHQPIGATRIIPLAPPAIAAVKKEAKNNDQSSSKNNNKFKSNLQHFAAWLSPRPSSSGSSTQSRIQQRSQSNNDTDTDHDGNYDDDHSKHRGHHQILMQRARGSSLDRTQVGTTASKSSTICAGDLHRANDSLETYSPVGATRSGAGGAYRHSPQQQQKKKKHQTSGSGSLLTTFLLYFDALLPEYFTHFPSASDIEHNGAANAVSVLERGARTVQLAAVSPIYYKRHTHGSSGGGSGDHHNRSIAPSSDSTNRSQFPPETSCSPEQQHRHHQWLNTREKLQRVAGQVVSPRHKKFNSTLQAEWERFTSPFLMLAGAEVLYGEMEHVLDPETERQFANGESPLVGSDIGMAVKAVVAGGSSSTAVQFDNSDKGQNKSTVPSPGDSNNNNNNKRGSRRLIAMYRQVREDFIIVGEYLCDPVLGSHTSNVVGGGGGGAASVISNNEFTPQSTFEMSPGSSPQRKMMYNRSQSQPVTPENKHTAPVQVSPSRTLNQETSSSSSSDESQRQIAARSLRGTLNALLVFIDARCVLVKIHADLCYWSSNQEVVPLSSGGNPAEGGRSGNKWAMLAEQCRSILLKLSFWTFNKDSMVQLALSKLETETKALELALLSIYHLMEYDFFNCVLHVRKLHVLLGRTAMTSLQLKWIKTSLRKTMSMMKIIFDNNANESPLLSRSPSLLKKVQKSEEAGQLDQIFSEFVWSNESGPPLAVLVVHRNAHSEHQEEEVDGLPVGGTSTNWSPLYIKSTLDKSRADATSVAPTLVQMIKNNFVPHKTNSNEIQQSGSEMEVSWPFSDWPELEKKLTAHSGIKAKTYIICNSPHKQTPSLSETKNQSKVKSNATSKCHIVRITEVLSIIAVQGVSPRAKPRQVSHLEESLAKLARRFRPENIFNASSVLLAKKSVAGPRFSKNANERGENSKKRPEISALWSGAGWSDVQRKQVLHSLGLRSKNSPVVSAPLKSPYVRRQMSRMRHRKKKKKNSLNTGHLMMFLGPELSHLI